MSYSIFAISHSIEKTKNHSKEKKLVLEKIHYENEFFKHCCFPQTNLAGDENEISYFSGQRLSTCGSRNAKLTGFTIRKCHPPELENCLKVYRYRKIDRKWYLKEPHCQIRQYRKTH